MAVSHWQKGSAWALLNSLLTWIILWFFNIVHAWTCVFSQQLDFLEHAVPTKHIQLYMQTHRQNNLYEQILSDITSQITFITIHMKYRHLRFRVFVLSSYVQYVRPSLQRESTLFRRSWVLLSFGGITRNTSFWQRYLSITLSLIVSLSAMIQKWERFHLTAIHRLSKSNLWNCTHFRQHISTNSLAINSAVGLAILFFLDPIRKIAKLKWSIFEPVVQVRLLTPFVGFMQEAKYFTAFSIKNSDNSVISNQAFSKQYYTISHNTDWKKK